MTLREAIVIVIVAVCAAWFFGTCATVVENGNTARERIRAECIVKAAPERAALCERRR